MIKKKTVFVLGAGASCAYGLPTGAQLRQRICEIPTKQTVAHTIIRKVFNIGVAEIQRFYSAFLTSGLQSIDSFLARNIAFEEIGKASIAACLLECESTTNLHHANGNIGDSDWYGLLWNRMIDGVVDPRELIKNNEISFITFNYDRTLEAFLAYAVRDSFGLDRDTANSIVNQIEIHHVYGSLGKLGGDEPTQFGIHSNDSQLIYADRFLKTAMSNIKVVPAQRHPDDDEVAKRMLRSADQILLLGFGFDQLNCERLGIAEVLLTLADYGWRNVYFTSLGMTPAEVNSARSLLTTSNYQGSLTSTSGACLSALREWGVLR